MLDRSHKAVSPESIRPQGLSKAEVIRRFKEARAKTIKFVQDTQLPLKEHDSEHPFPVFRTLNAYQWLLYTATQPEARPENRRGDSKAWLSQLN